MIIFAASVYNDFPCPSWWCKQEDFAYPPLAFAMGRLAVGESAHSGILTEIHMRHITSQTANGSNECWYINLDIFNGGKWITIMTTNGCTKFGAKDKKSNGEELERKGCEAWHNQRLRWQHLRLTYQKGIHGFESFSLAVLGFLKFKVRSERSVCTR